MIYTALCPVGWGDNEYQRRNHSAQREMIWGFRVEQTSSEKNPTPKVVDKQVKPESETQTAWTSQVEEKQSETAGGIVHKWFNSDDEKQEMIKYAYKLWWIDFVKMIECENWSWNIHAVGDSGKAFWLCQININYHKLPEWYKDDWKIQIDTCYQKWSNGTKFYWPSRIVKGQKCSSYVSSRFILN